MIDMGDFVGGMLKYLRAHPVPNVAIGGGFAKLCKLAQGNLDLHLGRSQVDLGWLAGVAASSARTTPSKPVSKTPIPRLKLCRCQETPQPLADEIARRARAVAQDTVGDTGSMVRVLVFDRTGNLVGQSDG